MMEWIIILVVVIAALIILFSLYFNRDPVRTIPPGKSIVSPADGVIIDIIDMLDLNRKKLESKIPNSRNKVSRKPKIRIAKGIAGKIRTTASEVSDHCYIIVIFMNLHNVHVQRAPLGGKVTSIRHTNGKFLAANSLKATAENEKIEMLIKNRGIGTIKVIQIAGFLTRRIESFVKKGENLLKGQRIGRIKLGSQVVLIMPDLPLNVKKGDKVTAGETVIAKYE